VHAHPATLSEWTAHLSRTWGLSPTDLSHRVPLHLVATTRSGHVVTFTGAGTTLRLAVLPASAAGVVMLRPDCDCGAPHGDRAVPRVRLDRFATPLWQSSVDGAARFGWRGVDAALAPVPRAAAVLDELLRRAAADAPYLLGDDASPARRVVPAA